MPASNQAQSQSELRRQLFIAPEVQGRLMLRIATYGIIASGFTAASYVVLDWISVPLQPWAAWLGPLMIGLAIAVPIILYDAVRITNRLLGPFARVHGAMRLLGNRDHVGPVQPREGDYWREWIEDFNLMAARVQANAPPRPGTTPRRHDGDSC